MKDKSGLLECFKCTEKIYKLKHICDKYITKNILLNNKVLLLYRKLCYICYICVIEIQKME